MTEQVQLKCRHSDTGGLKRLTLGKGHALRPGPIWDWATSDTLHIPLAPLHKGIWVGFEYDWAAHLLLIGYLEVTSGPM